MYLFQYCYYAEYWGEFFLRNCPAHEKTGLIASGLIISTSQSHPLPHLSPLSHGGGSPLTTHEFVWAEVADVSSLGMQLAKKNFKTKGHLLSLSDAEQLTVKCLHLSFLFCKLWPRILTLF